jgi:hypothetical protein
MGGIAMQKTSDSRRQRRAQWMAGWIVTALALKGFVRSAALNADGQKYQVMWGATETVPAFVRTGRGDTASFHRITEEEAKAETAKVTARIEAALRYAAGLTAQWSCPLGPGDSALAEPEYVVDFLPNSAIVSLALESGVKNGPQVDVFVARSRAKAEQVLAQPGAQRAIAAVAEALLERERLDEAQLLELVKQAKTAKPKAETVARPVLRIVGGPDWED